MMCRFHIQTAGSSLTAQPGDSSGPATLQRSRRCSAARRPCTRTRATKRWRCRPWRRPRLALRTQQVIALRDGRERDSHPLARLLLGRAPE